MKKALTSAIVSVAMVLSSVTAIAADTADSKPAAQAVQSGPLSPGGPVVVSPAQGNVVDTLGCGYDIDGICGPVVLVGVAGMGVLIAALMGAFSKAQQASSFTPATTGTGG